MRVASTKTEKQKRARVETPVAPGPSEIKSVIEGPQATALVPNGQKRWSPLHAYAFLGIVTLAALLPFSDRAFHIDDPLFVWAAQHIVQQPLNPYGFRLNWDGTDVQMSDVTKNPPLACYYAAAIGRLTNWKERPLHLGFLIPALGVILGTYCLARRFTESPLLASSLTLLAPGFLVSACSVMCDVMMVAIWVFAVVLWVEGLERDKWSLLFSSAVLIAACALTKYFGIALIPLFFAYAFYRQRRVGSWALSLLVPVIALATYQVWTRGIYSQGLLLDAAGFATGQRSQVHISIFGGGIVGLSFAGGCILSAVALAPLIWSRKQILVAAAASAFAALAILAGWVNFGNRVGGQEAILSLQQHLLLTGAELTLYIAGGVSVLALAISDFRGRKDANSFLLLLWVLGTFVFAALLNYTVNARSVLPLIPAAGILLARRIGPLQPVPRSQFLQQSVALAISGALAMWVTFGDTQLANSERAAADKIYETAQGIRGRVWFEGHWGFQYYMQLRGAHPVDFQRPVVAPGDIIVIPENNVHLYDVPPEIVAKQETIALSAPKGATTMSWPLGAGLYSSYWGPLPFAFGSVPAEHYMIYEIKSQGENEGR